MALHPEEKINGMPLTDYDLKDFVDCCRDVGLVDCSSIGSFYTWTNNRVLSKLDRCMFWSDWDLEGSSVLANFLLAGCVSDHSPCVVLVSAPTLETRRSFWFFNIWADHEEFQGIVATGWEMQIDGVAQFQLCLKLKRLKALLRGLSSRYFSHISARAAEAAVNLQTYQTRLDAKPQSQTLQDEVIRMKKSATLLLTAEYHYFRQKAKGWYLKYSDRCTKFFHAAVRKNR